MGSSLIFTNPKDAIDQSCWLLLNRLNELLRISYTEDDLNDQTSIEKTTAPFWVEVDKQLKSLSLPTNLSTSIEKKILSKSLKIGYDLWSNRNEGYDLDLLNILYFLDTFGLLKLKKSEYDYYTKNTFPELTEEIFEEDGKSREGIDFHRLTDRRKKTFRIRRDNPILKVNSETEFYQKILSAMYRIVMCQDYYFHLKRCKVIEQMKFSELSRFSQIRARLKEESQKIANTISSDTRIKNFGLAEMYIELGLTIPPVEGKIGLKFVKDKKGNFTIEK